MRKVTRVISGILLAMGIFVCRPSTAFAFYLPVEPGLKGVGSANVQTLEADLRSLEQAAILFRSENADALSENVNNIALLARYTDIPSRFGDTESYGFFVDSRGWWIGAAVQDMDAMRDSAAGAAGSHGWIGSANTMTPPGNAAFGAGDGAVWKLLR
jgi:hypothetical protein